MLSITLLEERESNIDLEERTWKRTKSSPRGSLALLQRCSVGNRAGYRIRAALPPNSADLAKRACYVSV
jgi:hypothetical protein